LVLPGQLGAVGLGGRVLTRAADEPGEHQQRDGADRRTTGGTARPGGRTGRVRHADDATRGCPAHPPSAANASCARRAASRRAVTSGPAASTSRLLLGSTLPADAPKMRRTSAAVPPCAPTPGASSGPL